LELIHKKYYLQFSLFILHKTIAEAARIHNLQ